MKPGTQLASIRGRSETVRVVRKAKRNSRVVPVDLVTGADTAGDELVATDLLTNIRSYKPDVEVLRTIRVTNPVYKHLMREAKPGETLGDVLQRILLP